MGSFLLFHSKLPGLVVISVGPAMDAATSVGPVTMDAETIGIVISVGLAAMDAETSEVVISVGPAAMDAVGGRRWKRRTCGKTWTRKN